MIYSAVKFYSINIQTKDDRIAQLEKELKNAQEKALQKTKSLDVCMNILLQN